MSCLRLAFELELGALELEPSCMGIIGPLGLCLVFAHEPGLETVA